MRQLCSHLGENVEVKPYNLQQIKFHLYQNLSVQYTYKSFISGVKLLLKVTKTI